MASPDVSIRGAGIVGRTLALLLAAERLRVALVMPKGESAKASATGSEAPKAPNYPDVRAYALNAASRELLESVRGWPGAKHATPVAEMQVFGDNGGRVDFDAARHDATALAWIVDVPALERQLADAVRFHPLIEEVSEAPAAPLTVVCEGRMSATRDALGVSYQVTPYAQQAIAARLEASEPHDRTARQWFSDRGDVLALLPLGGEPEAGDESQAAGDRQLGSHSLALVWSVDQFRAPELMAQSPELFCAALREATHDALGAFTLVGERAAWPLQRAIAERWTGRFSDGRTDGRAWALAGDAAHVVHPLAGQGLNLGLADASALAQVMKEREYWRSCGDARLLRRYERSRRGSVLAMSFATDGLQQLFSQQGGPLPQLRNLGMQGFDRTRVIKHWVARQAMGLQ